MKISKILPVAALGIALSVGATQKAEAYAYAYSDLQVKEGVITITGGGITIQPASTSTAEANLSGSGDSFSDTGVLADSPIAYGDGSTWSGLAPGNNDFALEGSSTSNKYSWGDSQIISEQNSSTGSKIATRQMAEGNTIDSDLAKSGADTSSVTEITFTTGAGGGTFNFNFQAALSMLAEITLPHTGIQALATARIEIQIANKSTGELVFLWLAGNDKGFGLAADATNAFSFADVSVASTGSSDSIHGFGIFDVTSVKLDEGIYNLSINATASERVQAQTIPAPGVLTLFGSGLVLLGLARRREKNAEKMAA